MIKILRQQFFRVGGGSGYVV